jgi:dipeptidyl aminopeptidase/acylaminoacyl peptidase
MLKRSARARFLLLALFFTVALGVARPQQASLNSAFEALFAMQAIREVSISPDGQRVAWVESLHGAKGVPSPHSTISVKTLSTPDATLTRITANCGNQACEEHDIAWSPDSHALAFLSNAQSSEQLELYVAGAGGGAARRLTDLNGALAKPEWSPDGKTVAFLFTEHAPRTPGPLAPMSLPSRVIGTKVYEQRVAMVELDSGRVRQISPPNLYVHQYEWSPDGKKFVATAAPGEGDSGWYVAEIYTFDLASGEARSIYKPPQQVAFPRWSPDGKSIAFIMGLMSDEGSNGGEVYVIPASGGEARDLTPGIKASPCWLAWQAGGREILLLENLDGASGIATLNVASGQLTPVWSGRETLSAGGANFWLSLASDGKSCAFVRDSYEGPPEVWAGPMGHWVQVTNLNQGLRPGWGKVESIHWPNEGFTIQGWLVYPSDYDPARRYPMVVMVHGGPSSMSRPHWARTFYDLTLLSQQGYFILNPNPRGSYGQGEAFTRANVRDFGYGDFRDILAGVDHVVKNFPVDDCRVGITGWSYGGYMTMWAVTQTTRFRAAVTGAGMSDLLSYYGENDIDQWIIPFFGAPVYDNPEIYARSSPINFIKKVKTPTLILVGDRDGECPAPQSFEFWHALRDLGVENQFVVYPNEGHNIEDSEHRRDIFDRTVEWFNHYLK